MGIDIKAHIPKTFPSIPKLDIGKAKDTIKHIDVKALARGLGVVIIIYALIHLFVWLKSDATIEYINSQMPNIHVEITKIDAPHSDQHNEQKIPKDTFLVDGLSTDTLAGELPIIRQSDFLTSFRAYQTPFQFDKKNQKPVIAFIIKDYGLSVNSSSIATQKLPAEVSLMLSTYAKAPSRWVTRAHSKGHEVWITLPIQNNRQTDQGSDTVFHHATLNEKQNTIYKTLTKTLGYVGIASSTDKTFESAKNDYSQLFDEIYNRGLGYLELNPNAPSTIKGKAISKGAPYIQADIEINRMKGQNSFDNLEEIAKNKGYALAVIPNHPVAIDNLTKWLEKVGKIDYQIAPVSAIYDIPAQKNSTNSELRGEDLIDPDKYE